MQKIQNLFGQILQEMWNNQTQQNKQNKRSFVAYVYGQIYAEYLKQDKAEFLLIENENVREWKRIVMWLKTNNHIKDFAYSDNEENKDKLAISGFNEKKLIYKNYLKGIERNIA